MKTVTIRTPEGQGTWLPHKLEIEHAGPSSAPSAAELIGRATGDLSLTLAPRAGELLAKLDASLRGVFEDPAHPIAARRRILAETLPGLDIHLRGGARLSVLDAASGHFIVRLSPPRDDYRSTTHAVLFPNGKTDRDAIVELHPHSPRAPVGFYNAREAKRAVTALSGVLQAAERDPRTSAIDRLRARNARDRLASLGSFLDRLIEAAETRPELRAFSELAAHAYGTKAAGDEHDRAYRRLATELHAYVDAGAGGLSRDLLDRARLDLESIAKDRSKWLAWHASTGLFTLYVPAHDTRDPRTPAGDRAPRRPRV